MKITITHARNPLVGWDINVTADAGEAEKISYAEIRINDFRDVREDLEPPLDSWDRQLTQKGVYPGDNKVQVMVRDQRGLETRKQQKW